MLDDSFHLYRALPGARRIDGLRRNGGWLLGSFAEEQGRSGKARSSIMAYRVCVGSLSIIAANEGEALEVFKELSKHNARVIIRDDEGAQVDPDHLRSVLARHRLGQIFSARHHGADGPVAPRNGAGLVALEHRELPKDAPGTFCYSVGCLRRHCR